MAAPTFRSRRILPIRGDRISNRASSIRAIASANSSLEASVIAGGISATKSGFSCGRTTRKLKAQTAPSTASATSRRARRP
jgi:hypothetical protein